MSVAITTYGVLHGAPPSAVDPIRVDLTTALRNPADDPAMIEMTDQAFRMIPLIEAGRSANWPWE